MIPTTQIRTALRQLQRLLPRGEAGVTLLEYHLVGGGTASPVDIPPAAFRAHLRELRGTARVVPLDAALRELAAGTVTPRTVVLTFDDAYQNFYTQIFPLLEDAGFPATLYVPTGFVHGTAPAPITGTGDLPACSWSQLRAMQQSGLVTIGAHTRTHPSLTKVKPAQAHDEIVGAKHELEDQLSTAVTSFCYPRALTTKTAEAMVAETYQSATVGGGVRQRPATFSPHHLRRVPIRTDMPPSLEPILRSPVWLEEWLADKLRRFVK